MLVNVMFRADDEPAASRLDYWHQVVGDMIAPLELRIEEGLGAPDRLLVGHLDDRQVESPRLGTAVLDVVAAALAARFDRPEAAPPESRQRTLLLQIQAFVEQRLGDPELSPATIGPTVRCNHWGHGWKASPSGLATTTV